MRIQLSLLLSAAGFPGLAEAVNQGWMQPHGVYNVDTLCSGQGDQFYRVCFTTDIDMTTYDADSNFNGIMSADKKEFVIYWLGDPSAVLKTKDYKITVNFDVKIDGSSHCASAIVEDLKGNPVDSVQFCGQSYSRSTWAHIPQPNSN